MIKARLELATPVDKGLPSEMRYNLSLCRSITTYLGHTAINLAKAQSGSVKYDPSLEATKLLKAVIEEVEPELLCDA
ncbi:hypothetical protein JCM10207_003759 [Rhodosporidiobolus poonsookiae]